MASARWYEGDMAGVAFATVGEAVEISGNWLGSSWRCRLLERCGASVLVDVSLLPRRLQAIEWGLVVV